MFYLGLSKISLKVRFCLFYKCHLLLRFHYSIWTCVVVFNVSDNETNLIKIRYRRVDDLDLVC